MLLNLVKTFGTPPGFNDFVGSRARVRKTGTQDPVRLYTAEGILLSNNGQLALGNDGLLDVWVSPGHLYDLDLLNPIGVLVLTLQGIDPAGGTGLSREQSSQLAQLFAASAEAGNVVYDAKSFAFSTTGLDIEVSDLELTGTLAAAIQTNVDWGDGNTENNAGDLRTLAAQHTYAAEGTYLVKVTPKATASGVLGAPATSRVPVSPPAPGPFDIYVGRYTDTLIITVGWNINLESWDTTLIEWGDGNTTVLDANTDPAHEYATEGTYTVVVHERVAGVPTGRTGTLTFDTTTADDFGPSPYGALGEMSATNAIDDVTSIQFWDRSRLLEGAAVTSWLWSFGDTTTSTAQNPTHTYTAPGTYQVTLAIDGGSPVALSRSVVVVAAPSAPAVTLRAQDTFTGDGAVKDRALTTPYAGVFDTWKASDNTNPLTSGGKLISAVPGAFGQFYSQQWDFATPVTPPAALQKFTVALDFTPGVTSTDAQPYNSVSQWQLSCTGTTGSTNDGTLFVLTVQADAGTDTWRFTSHVFGADTDTRVVVKTIAKGSSVNIKFVMSDTEAYILIGNSDIMVFNVAGRGVIGALNAMNMQLGPPVGGNPALDNLTVSSIN